MPRWKALLEEFPDRFLAAVDAVEPFHYGKFYRAAVSELRSAVSTLRPGVAQRVAFENAERLLARTTSAG